MKVDTLPKNKRQQSQVDLVLKETIKVWRKCSYVEIHISMNHSCYCQVINVIYVLQLIKNVKVAFSENLCYVDSLCITSVRLSHKNQRLTQNPVKHLRSNFLRKKLMAKAVNHFRKTPS